jgi:hypothetical protein
MMALAAWALVSVLGQSVEDALVAIGDLQLIEREVGRLDAHLHAADLRAAAQRSCFEHCDNVTRYESCQIEVLRSLSLRFLPSQEAVQHAGAGETAPCNRSWGLRQRPLLALGITSLIYDHLKLLAPLGTCLFFAGVCPPRPHLANKLVDEAADTYSQLGLGSDRDACFERARVHWEACGRVIDAPVSVVWRSDPSVSLADADWSDFPVLPSDPRADDYYTSLTARTGGAWKQIHIWIDESTYHGLSKSSIPAVPSRYVSEKLFNQQIHLDLFSEEMQVHETARGQEACWTRERLQTHVDGVFATWEGAYASQYNFELYREQIQHANAKASLSSTFPGELDADGVVVAIFEGKHGGFFIELAAFDAMLASNSLALERDYRWQGLCVEANAMHWEGLAHRNCTVVAALVADETGLPMQFDARPGADGQAGIVSPDTDNVGKDELSAELKTLRSVTIDKVLHDFRAPAVIDYLSLDVEGAEHLILKAFPWHSHTVHVISIERPDLCSRTYLRKAGFHFLMSLADQDEVWLHPSLPRFSQVMREMGRHEPLERNAFSGFEKSLALQDACAQMTKDLLEVALLPR